MSSFLRVSKPQGPPDLGSTVIGSIDGATTPRAYKAAPSTANVNKLIRLAKSCDRALRPILASIQQQATGTTGEDFETALLIISCLSDNASVSAAGFSHSTMDAMFKSLPKLETSVQTLYKKPLTSAHITVLKAFLDVVPESFKQTASEWVGPASPKRTTFASPRFVAPDSPEGQDLVGLRDSLRMSQRGADDQAGKVVQGSGTEFYKVENKKKLAGLVENLFKGGQSNLEIQRNGIIKAIEDRDLHRLSVMFRDLLYDHTQPLREDGTTALHLAAELGFTEAVQMLIGYGANTSARDANAFAPIHRAASAGHMDTITLLLQHTPAEVAQGCIHLAAMANQPVVIKGLVAARVVHIDERSGKNRDTPLHLAARNAANEAIAACLDLGADVCLLNAEGRTALQEALYSRAVSKPLLHRLLDATIEGDRSVLQTRDVHGQTVLHAAAAYNDAEICRKLMDMGFSPNEADKAGRTPLFEAAKHGSYQTFVALLEGGADPMHRAANGRTVAHELGPGSEEIARLIARDYPELLSIADNDGEIPAMVAAKRPDVSNEIVATLMAATPAAVLRDARDNERRDILHCLLENSRIELAKQYLRSGDFSPNNVNTVTGATSFQMACMVAGDDLDLLQMLIDQGAALRHQSRDGNTAAHLLVAHDFIDGLELVVKLDRELTNLTNAKGQTPCHIAAETQNAAALRLLMETGIADLSMKDGFGDTVLLTAAKVGADDVVEACIDAGVELNSMREEDGKTSVYEACYYGHKEVVRMLIVAGADLAKKDKKGWHALHAAAWGHEFERVDDYATITALCLLHGAPVDVENHEGSTPLYFAARKGHLPIVQELLKFKPRLRGKTYETDPLAAAQTARKSAVSVALLRAGYPVLEMTAGKPVFLYDAYGQTPFHNALIMQDDDIEHELPEPPEIAVLYEKYPSVDWANLPDQRGLHPLVLTALIYDQPYCTFHLLKRGSSMKKYASGVRTMIKHFPTVEPFSAMFASEMHLMALAATFGRDSSMTIAAFLGVDAPELGDTSIQELFPFAEAKQAEAPPAPSELRGG